MLLFRKKEVRTMSEEVKCWTSKRKSSLVIQILKGQTSIAEAAREFDITPSEIESWLEDAQRGIRCISTILAFPHHALKFSKLAV
jgi:transposase-like protein